MRKIKNIILIMLFIMLVGTGINVKAESFNYYISNSNNNYEHVDSSKDIKRGDIILVTAIVDNKDNVSDYQLSDGKFTIRWDDKFVSLQEVNGKYYNDSITDINSLSIGGVNKVSNKLTISGITSTTPLKSGKNKLFEFKFQVLSNSPTGETKIYQMDGEDNLKCVNTKEENKVGCGESLLTELKYNVLKSTINKLSSIKINGQELDGFNEDKNDYNITVESNVDKVNIMVTKKDSKSTISGNYGENPVSYGLNKFIVNVISESGLRNTYNINITRNDSRSSVNTLKTLTISSGELSFNPNVLDYNINVLNEVNKVTITSSLTDSKSKYVTDFQNKEIELIEGGNKVEIKVISEKGDEKVYTLNITRALSSNNSLKSLKINDEKIKLEEGKYTYDITFENDVEEAIVKAEANDAKATITIDDKYPLQVGENEINIIVTAASGEKASYIVNVTRKKLLSKDSLLTSIKIKGYDFDFKQDVTLYYLKIKDSDKELEITTIKEDDNAIVEIEGNKDLENGSIIKINVKAEDGTFTRYFINIEKGSSGISPVIIILIVLFILLGLCIGLIIYRKKKKGQSKFDKLDEVKKENNDLEEEKVVSNQDDSSLNETDNIEEKGAHEYIGEHEHIDEQENLQNNQDNEKDIE